MKDFLSNKDLLKDTFQALAYFVFIAGFVKLALPHVTEQGIAYKLLFIALLLSPTSLAMAFAILNVCGPITKIRYPDFKSPIDKGKPKPISKQLKEKATWFWIATGIPFYVLGGEIVQLGLN